MRTPRPLRTLLLCLLFAKSVGAEPARGTAPPPEPPPADATDPNPSSNALEPADSPGDDSAVQLNSSQEGYYEPAPVVVVSGPQQEPPATGVRADRRLALLGELGWNTLAGFGPNLTFHLTPHISGDLGTGLSLTGWKLGLRGRYNLLKAPVTPFVGLGFMATSGFGSSPLEIVDDTGNQLLVKIRPSYFVQGVLGLDYTSPRGFTMVMTAGYAWVLNDNVDIVSGVPTEASEKLLNATFGSFLATSIAIGYSFR